jgi:hypothetical protein
MQRPSDEDLMAYADGEMPAAQAESLARLIATDETVRQRVEMFRQSRSLLAGTLKPLADTPVPDSLEQSIRDMITKSSAEASTTATGEDAADNVVSFRPKPAQPVARTPRPWSVPLAAAIAAAVAGIGGYAAGLSGGAIAPDGVLVGSLLPAEIGNALDTTASGGEARLEGDRIRLIASVKAQDGTLCREFEIESLQTALTMAGIACRDAGKWRLDIAVAAPASEGGFAPASSLSALDSYLAAIGASEQLSVDEESSALGARNGSSE